MLFGRGHSGGVHPGLMRKSISSLQCVRLEKTGSVFNRTFTTSMVKKGICENTQFCPQDRERQQRMLPWNGQIVYFFIQNC